MVLTGDVSTFSSELERSQRHALSLQADALSLLLATMLMIIKRYVLFLCLSPCLAKAGD